MRWLSIIDLAHGEQPFFNHDKTKVIVFNGVIYNFQELREKLEKLGHQFYTKSDTEAIIHLYDEYGTDCLRFLRGMFAFAIWDERSKELLREFDGAGEKSNNHHPESDGFFAKVRELWDDLTD